jgi:hypothetical protein
MRRKKRKKVKARVTHCTVEACESKVHGRGMCRKHYNAQYFQNRQQSHMIAVHIGWTRSPECPHEGSMHYAKGCCKACYERIHNGEHRREYMRNRRLRERRAQDADLTATDIQQDEAFLPVEEPPIVNWDENDE